MFEESLSILASMNTWFTPTVLFVLLNLVIGTIAITSSLGTQKQQQEQPQRQQQEYLARSPSVLQRLKSVNFYSFRSSDHETHFAAQESPPLQMQQVQVQPQLARSPSVLQRLKSVNLYNYLSHEAPKEEAEEAAAAGDRGEESKGEEEEEEQSIDEVYGKLKGHRTYSDLKPASGEIPTKLPSKMKKSASAKSAFAHFEEEDVMEARRPATVKEGKPKASAEETDDEVDARADDFINKFKQQLKLQRIDSIIRYKDMISRASAK